MMSRSHVSFGLIAALLVTLAGCWSTGGEDDDPTSVISPDCTADAGNLYRCNGEVVEQCNGSSWETVEDCGAGGKSCEQTGSGMARCGGLACSTGETDGKCNPGSDCARDADCASGVCGDNQVCLPATCANGEQDGDETGPDCGGSCPKCVGDPCSRDAHCITNYCKSSACASPSCTDNQQNGTETGTDCGGECSPCPVGTGCNVASDCKTGRCDGGTCADLPATCDDGEQNGEETDVDCGGSDCGACPLEDNCEGGDDCLSGFCKFGVCKEATCSDDTQNQGEADVDCGGENCAGCPDGKACKGNRDCQSGRCINATCISCSDGKRNGQEVGVDCGGPCRACQSGTSCQSDSTCSSGRCEGGTCASCSDGRQSGGETGVDCGGPCRGCSEGGSCSSDGDCSTGKCENGSCCRPNQCGNCGPLPEETCNGRDDDCDGRTDEGLAGSAPDCSKQQGVCSGAKAECRGSQGWTCDDQLYAAHSSDYNASKDINCDNIDNDCDGQVDEDPCPDDGNPCTKAGCDTRTDSCVQRDERRGTYCGMGSSKDEQVKHCTSNGTCDSYSNVCICSGGSCVYYEREFGSTTTRYVNSCRCSGNSIVYGLSSTSCGICNTVTHNGDTRYMCR